MAEPTEIAAAELEALGLYDPRDPDAGARLGLLPDDQRVGPPREAGAQLRRERVERARRGAAGHA